MSTYTFVEGTARTDEETSTDGATDGNHVQMARLHRLVEDDHWAGLGTALEGPEIETIAGREALLLAPVAMVLVGRGGGRVRHCRLLIDGMGLLVVHGGRAGLVVAWRGEGGTRD